MKTICRILARIFKSIYLFFERRSGAERTPAPLPKNDKKTRLRYLLSQSDLAADEQKELAGLVSQMEGDVIFLDPPVQPAAKEDL